MDFCRRKTAENNNAKINVSPNIPYTILLFKACAFLQIFFPRNLLSNKFGKRQLFSSSKCLKTSNKRTHIPLYCLYINQIVSLI